MKLFNSITLFFIISLTSLTFAQSTQFKPEKEMVQVYPTYHSLEIEVGDKLYYTAYSETAIRAEGKAWSENETLLKLSDVHLHQQLDSSSTIKTYVFQALKPGKCNIVFEETFKGKVLQEYKVEISIVKDGNKKQMEFYEEFYKNGNLKYISPVYNALNKTLNGPVKLYHENGKLFVEGTIKDQSKSGKWNFYNENGNLSYSGEYRNIGYSEGDYEAENKVGEWIAYGVEKEVLFKELNHDYINNINQYRYFDSIFTIDRSQIYFTNNQNELAPYNKKENGKSYRIIDFKENQPLYSKGFKKNNKDLSIINGDWGQVEIKFHKKVKYIKVDYFDDGCGEAFTEFTLKNSLKKKIHFSKNILLLNQNFIFNDPKTLNKMTSFEIYHCEGITDRITIIYE